MAFATSDSMVESQLLLIAYVSHLSAEDFDTLNLFVPNLVGTELMWVKMRPLSHDQRLIIAALNQEWS